jgi:phage gp16-like protein
MANSKEKQTRDREIRLIHVGRRELQLDEETYRAMLQSVAGVDSSAKLDASGRRNVLDHMKSKGFQVKSNAKTAAASRNAADPQYRKIQALWSELARLDAVQVNTEAAIRVYIKRITGVTDFAFCNNAQVTVIIESLKKWRNRVEGANRTVESRSEDAHDRAS